MIDGTLGLGERGRPTAVLKLGFIRQEGDPSHWRFRVNVLSPKPIEVEFPDGPTWTSRTPGLELRPLPNVGADRLGGSASRPGQSHGPAVLGQCETSQSERPDPVPAAHSADRSI